MPFRPEAENEVTTLPLAGHRQRFTGTLPSFAARLPPFFRPPEEVVDLLLDAFPEVGDDLFAGLSGARALGLWPLAGAGRAFFSMLPEALAERCAERVEAVGGGCVSRNC